MENKGMNSKTTGILKIFGNIISKAEALFESSKSKPIPRDKGPKDDQYLVWMRI